MSRKTRRKNRKKTSSLMAAPEVAVTVAVATPKDSLMSPPERKGKAEGGINQEYMAPPSNSRGNNKEYMASPKARQRGMYEAARSFPEESIRERFNKAFAEARKNRQDTFMFEGKRYTTDYPVSKEDKAAQAAARANKAEGGKAENSNFPDLTGDGKVTQADVLHGRGVFQEGGEVPVDTYPNIPPEEMAAAQASQLPDEQMEDDYIDYVMNEALSQEEQTYLMNALEADPQLSMIFDKVVGTASEFTGSGEVAGPGTGVSDSIPARLSDGEFVITKKATDQIGAENLQRMMDDAERAYDGGLMKNGEEMERNINEVMMSANQMPSLNVRQR